MKTLVVAGEFELAEEAIVLTNHLRALKVQADSIAMKPQRNCYYERQIIHAQKEAYDYCLILITPDKAHPHGYVKLFTIKTQTQELMNIEKAIDKLVKISKGWITDGKLGSSN